MKLKQAVVFAILMENNEGIKVKAPSYILEKLEMCEKMEHPERLLDSGNFAKFNRWLEKWDIEGD